MSTGRRRTAAQFTCAALPSPAKPTKWRAPAPSSPRIMTPSSPVGL